jgi:hypothetical protein
MTYSRSAKLFTYSMLRAGKIYAQIDRYDDVEIRFGHLGWQMYRQTVTAIEGAFSDPSPSEIVSLERIKDVPWFAVPLFTVFTKACEAGFKSMTVQAATRSVTLGRR